MAQNKDKLATDIRAVLSKLRAILEEIEEAPAPIPFEFLKRMESDMKAGRCLQCTKVKKEPYRRGLCGACYRKTQLMIDAGEATVSSLEAQGIYAPKGQPGRRKSERTRLDEYASNRRLGIDPLAAEMTDRLANPSADTASESAADEAMGKAREMKGGKAPKK